MKLEKIVKKRIDNNLNSMVKNPYEKKRTRFPSWIKISVPILATAITTAVVVPVVLFGNLVPFSSISAKVPPESIDKGRDGEGQYYSNNSGEGTEILNNSDKSAGEGAAYDKGIYVAKPEDTNLEFWITERATYQDFIDKGCTEIPGMFGGSEFLDSRYEAVNQGSMLSVPDVHVTYIVTGYPDVLDESAITSIEITDPIITVYGLTINSTKTEIDNRIADFSTVSREEKVGNETTYCFNIDKASFRFTSGKISISVEVTNNSGVVF